MTLLTTYEDFIERVESLGFMTLSQIIPGLPSLGAETKESAWHMGPCVLIAFLGTAAHTPPSIEIVN